MDSAKTTFRPAGIYAVEDVTNTKRLAHPFQAATCWTCKSSDVPRMMNDMGTAEFYAANFHDLKDEMTHPIGCIDCHDPDTMRLRISRPALIEGFAAQGKDITQATLQEMRSLVCAQCHVEYYFAKEPQNYLTLPWHNGVGVEGMIDYFDRIAFADYIHPISKTPIIKSQHPDYELYTTGIHAYRNVACADCHMPYRSEGGVKFTTTTSKARCRTSPTVAPSATAGAKMRFAPASRPSKPPFPAQ